MVMVMVMDMVLHYGRHGDDADVVAELLLNLSWPIYYAGHGRDYGHCHDIAMLMMIW